MLAKPPTSKFSRVEIKNVKNLDASLGSVYSLQYSMDGKFLAAGFQNGSIQVGIITGY